MKNRLPMFVALVVMGILSTAMVVASPNPNPPTTAPTTTDGTVSVGSAPTLEITVGDLQVIQDPTYFKLAAPIQAVATPSGPIRFTVTGPGKDYVQAPANPVSATTWQVPLNLFNRGAGNLNWEKWKKDNSYVIITAKANGLTKTVRVNLIKFQRGGKFAPGSDPVTVELKKDTAGGTNYAFPGAAADFWFQLDGNPAYGFTQTAKLEYPANGNQPEKAESELSVDVNYSNSADQGAGAYSLDEALKFRASATLDAKWKVPNHQTWRVKDGAMFLKMGAGVITEFNNNRLTFSADRLAGGRDRFPPALPRIPGVQGRPTSVELKYDGDTTMTVNYTPEFGWLPFNGTITSDAVKGAVTYANIAHTPGAVVNQSIRIRMRAAARVESDGGWDAKAKAETWFHPSRPTWKMVFTPNF